MKPLPRQHKQISRLEISSKGNSKSRSLHRLKADALAASASSRHEPVDDAREAFGFFPKGLQGVVIRWPTL